MNAEQLRLIESRERRVHWKRWGPYLSERSWGTVREDYSATGESWDFFPHDHARSKTYRWGEDGLGGICDRHQYLCFALALWNGRDPFLKERLFGLTGPQGNHGEDVKEHYYYLDSTPTHSYMRFLYKYPQRRFPYEQLVEENRRRGREEPEYELFDTGIFDDDRYFDIEVEYAKAGFEDICIRITATNRGPDAALLELLPTIWFRNEWSFGLGPKPVLREIAPGIIECEHAELGKRWLHSDAGAPLLFTENETNYQRLYHAPNGSRYVKDGINDFIVRGMAAVNPERTGTKASVRHSATLFAGEKRRFLLRLTASEDAIARGGRFVSAAACDPVFEQRLAEADEFYACLAPTDASSDALLVQRQAFAGLLWTKQFYYYDVKTWMRGDWMQPAPPEARRKGRNHDWTHLYNSDVLSMPDKWEYPWYAAWDTAFHTIPLALVDPDFAKEQLVLLLREWYMHPNGQIPAYEWAFGDVNPPVHAWAAWRVYKIDQKRHGVPDTLFLKRVFHKLLLNFTWWINRKDLEGNNLFEGGFLGLDNIGVFDRSKPLPTGGFLEQSDGTSWMAMYTLNLLAIALELAADDPSYEDVASKFFEHFVYITRAMNHRGVDGGGLWDDADGFYYDVIRFSGGGHYPLKIRSMVGLIPLFAVEILEPEVIDRLPGFKRRMEWFLNNYEDIHEHLDEQLTPDGRTRRLLSVVNLKRLPRVLKYLFDEDEFLSPHGVRALSKYHREHPFELRTDSGLHSVSYEPGESRSGLFGGNSNWRGPVWFPVNFLLIESLQRFHHFVGGDLRVEYPARSGNWITLWDAAADMSRRLNRLFLRDENGRRPIHGEVEKLQWDPHWSELLPFHEYFHGDTGKGLGASHQTGWTGLVAKLLQQSGE